MSTVKVILAGVSDYKAVGAVPLPFCKNDVLLMRKTLINGLDIDPADIITLGLKYYESIKRFTVGCYGVVVDDFVGCSLLR